MPVGGGDEGLATYMRVMRRLIETSLAALAPGGRRGRRCVAIAVVTLCSALVALAAERWLPVVHGAANWADDIRAALLRPIVPQSPDIVLFTISEDTLSQF